MRRSELVELGSVLDARGYVYVPAYGSSTQAVLDLARALGPFHLPSGVDPSRPYLETNPTAHASNLEPFNRREGIGWHNDFSSHRRRPALSLAYLARADPLGPQHGAWRVASCDLVVNQLLATADGPWVLRILRDRDLPFSFAGGEPVFHRALVSHGSPGRLGLRFYGRAMRDGARLAYGEVPEEIARAIGAIETAADTVGRVLEAPAGSVLITDNWHALHDRLPQTVDGHAPLRRSLLCFVDRGPEPLG